MKTLILSALLIACSPFALRAQPIVVIEKHRHHDRDWRERRWHEHE
jgi:hypothetical protein